MKNLFLFIAALFVATTIQAQQSRVFYGDVIKIKHYATGQHLHSHNLNYGHTGSSGQQQVTAYGGSDDNDYWVIKVAHGSTPQTHAVVRHNDIIRLEHFLTRRNLHSHSGYPSPVTGQQETTCWGANGEGDSNDNWRIEVEGGGVWKAGTRIRLIHVNSNHALHSHSGYSHPQWTHGQQEVTSYVGRDDNDFWYSFKSN
jgi:dolichyl-phosphate-mannose--protein O-mannosyl transferase